MVGFLLKFIFLLKKPKIIIVAGKGRALATEAIFQVLKQKFKTEKIAGGNFSLLWCEILIFETELEKIEDLRFFIKNSKTTIFLSTHIGEIPSDKYFFVPLEVSRTGENHKVGYRTVSYKAIKPLTGFAEARKETEKMRRLIGVLPPSARLVLNFDDETIRELGGDSNIPLLTFGFQEGVDLKASDLHFNRGINFKINYKGNVVPVWLDSPYSKGQIYSALAAAACGIIFDLNLVEISKALKAEKIAAN